MGQFTNTEIDGSRSPFGTIYESPFLDVGEMKDKSTSSFLVKYEGPCSLWRTLSVVVDKRVTSLLKSDLIMEIIHHIKI